MPRKPSVIRDAKDVYESFKGIARHKRERVYSILMEGESVLGIEKVSSGSDGLVDVSPDAIYRPALERDCKSVIVVQKRGGGDVDEFDHFRHGGTRRG